MKAKLRRYLFMAVMFLWGSGMSMLVPWNWISIGSSLFFFTAAFWSGEIIGFVKGEKNDN